MGTSAASNATATAIQPEMAAMRPLYEAISPKSTKQSQQTMLQACGFGYFSCSLEVFALRYKLLRKLGKGGMGSVWLAERLGLGKNVAIKILDGATSENASGHERFAREAKALAALKSRNIVSILDFGVHNGTPFHVMEVLDGEDLEHRLRRVGRMTPVALAPFVDHVCRGLLRAHSAGLVHRDLKPANIFLAQEEGEEIAKLIDFGIVKVMGKDGKNVTQTGDVIGTPLYMSPVQVRGNRDVDHRSDLWSLGVTVFRALTGRLPFDGQTSGDILVRICTDPVPNIRALNPNLPPEAEGFIERALAREPHDRFQTAEDFANAFQSVAKAQSSHSGPQSSRRTPIVSVPPVAIGDSGAKSRSGASISSAASSSRRALTGIDAAPVSGRLSASGARLRPETYDSRGATSNPSERNLVPWFAAIFVVMAGGRLMNTVTVVVWQSIGSGAKSGSQMLYVNVSSPKVPVAGVKTTASSTIATVPPWAVVAEGSVNVPGALAARRLADAVFVSETVGLSGGPVREPKTVGREMAEPQRFSYWEPSTMVPDGEAAQSSVARILNVSVCVVALAVTPLLPV